MTPIREQIQSIFLEMWAEEHDSPAPELDDETILLETGFDSMSYAVLIAIIDDQLGLDPFSEDEDAYYPTTFGEFVSYYERWASHAQSG